MTELENKVMKSLMDEMERLKEVLGTAQDDNDRALIKCLIARRRGEVEMILTAEGIDDASI